MSLKDTINSDLGVIATDLGNQVIEWRGEEYECIPASTSKGLNLEMGGLGGESTFVFTLRKELFVDCLYPQPKETLVYRDATFRIEFVRQDPSGAMIRLFCVDNNRGV